MPDQPYQLLYDVTGAPVGTFNGSSFAPVTGRPATAHTSPQGGVVTLGSDMAGKAQVPKVDALGNQYVITQSPGGGASTYQASSTVTSTTAVYGPVVMGLQSTTVVPLRLDTLASLVTTVDQYPTFAAVAGNVALGGGKSLLALINKSSTGSVVRLVAIFVQNTSQQTATLLTAYQQVAYEVRPIIGTSANGTSIGCTAYDTADTLDAGVACYTGATVTGDNRGALRRWTSSNYGATAGGAQQETLAADQQGRDPWVSKMDNSAKHIVVRPGGGVHLRCATSVTTGQCDVTFVFTVAPA